MSLCYDCINYAEDSCLAENPCFELVLESERNSCSYYESPKEEVPFELTKAEYDLLEDILDFDEPMFTPWDQRKGGDCQSLYNKLVELDDDMIILGGEIFVMDYTNGGGAGMGSYPPRINFTRKYATMIQEK